MHFKPAKQYEGIRRRRGAVVMLHPYSPLPGELELYPMAYGVDYDQNYGPPLPADVPPMGTPSGGSFDPSAWVPLVGGLFQLVGGAVKNHQANRNQQQVVYVPTPEKKSNTGLWLGVGAVSLVGILGLGYWAFKE